MSLFTFGIDLGTTNSCVAISNTGKYTVIPTNTGKHTIPSCVSFNNDRILVGDINPDEAVAIGASILAEDLVRGLREKEEKGVRILVNAADGKPLEDSFSCMNVSVTGRTIHSTNSGTLKSTKMTEQSMGFKVPLSGSIRTIKVNDVISHSLGVGILGDKMSIILEKNKPIPYKHTEKYYTTHDNQKHVKVPCYEGEDFVASKNTKLYECRIDDIPPKRAGGVRFDITMDVNENGILMVSVKETTGAVKMVNFSINL